MRPSVWAALNVAPRPSVRLSVRQSHASDFLRKAVKTSNLSKRSAGQE